MSDKSIAGLVAAAVAAPLCAICILGPGFIVSAATGVSGWFGGLDVTTSTALAVIAGFLVYGLSRWRTARTAPHEEAADKP